MRGLVKKILIWIISVGDLEDFVFFLVMGDSMVFLFMFKVVWCCVVVVLMELSFGKVLFVENCFCSCGEG